MVNCNVQRTVQKLLISPKESWQGVIRVNVLKSVMDSLQCKLHHFAAFVKYMKALVVWDDEVDHWLQGAENLETGFVKLVLSLSDESHNGDMLNDDERARSIDLRSVKAENQKTRPVKLT